MNIQTFRRIESAKARVVRIKNILALETIYISEILLKEAEEKKNIEIIGDMKEMSFDSEGNLC